MAPGLFFCGRRAHFKMTWLGNCLSPAGRCRNETRGERCRHMRKRVRYGRGPALRRKRQKNLQKWWLWFSEIRSGSLGLDKVLQVPKFEGRTKTTPSLAKANPLLYLIYIDDRAGFWWGLAQKQRLQSTVGVFMGWVGPSPANFSWLINGLNLDKCYSPSMIWPSPNIYCHYLFEYEFVKKKIKNIEK